MRYQGNQHTLDTTGGRAAANDASPKGIAMPAVPMPVRSPYIAVVQRKEPYDSQAKDKWEELRDQIVNASKGRLSDEEVERYMKKELDIEHPDDLDLQSKADLGEYVSGLRIDAGKVAYDMEEAKKQEEIKKEWIHFVSWDGPPQMDDDADLNYSSEEDEDTEDEEKFRRVVAVITSLNRLLEEYLEDAPERAAFAQSAQSVIKTIVHYKGKDDKKKVPTDKVPVVPITSGRDWAGFGKAFQDAKATRGQKPTVYNIEYSIWPGAASKNIGFRGRQLKDAKGHKGRSWAEIALSLHELATALGKVFVKTAEGNTAAGTRILAAAMLAILGGKGAEVKAYLQKAGLKNLDSFEELVLEFFALTMGIESIRMAFSQLDVVLHLNNIAQGRTLGATNHRYDFLNVFSTVRTTKKGLQHVYTHGQYIWHRRRNPEDFDTLTDYEIIDDIADTTTDMEIQKEVTSYQGFNTAPIESSKNRPKERGSIKSAKSAGKSSFSHSAGHGKTEKLFYGNKETLQLLWEQIQTRAPKDRRAAHEKRLYSMGPIRIYNLLAGILKRYEKETADMNPRKIAGYLLELYTDFLQGTQPGSDNPFYNELAGGSGDFDFLVKNILQAEKAKEVDMDTVRTFQEFLTIDKPIIPFPFKDTELMEEVMLYLLRQGYRNAKDGNTLLHEAVRLDNLDWAGLLLHAGADLQAENNEGETPLACAIRLGRKAIAALMVNVQDSRKEKQKEKKQLPEDWKKIAGKKKKIGDQWLADNEVGGMLLTAALPNTHIAPAVDIANNPDFLATFIRDNYLNQMAGGHVEQYTVVPINFNNRHWTTLVIVQNPARRSQPTIYFFDSLGNDDQKIKLIKLMLQMTGVYTRVDTIHELSRWVQEDGYTCGTWMVQAATTIVKYLIKGATPKEIDEALYELRKSIQALHEEALAKRGGSKKEHM